MPAKIILHCVCIFILLPFKISAEEDLRQSCLKVLRDCLILRSAKSVQCYKSAAIHPFCQGLEINQIFKERILYEQGKITTGTNPRTLGAKIVDPGCLEKFDQSILAKHAADASRLKIEIVSCLKDAKIDQY